MSVRGIGVDVVKVERLVESLGRFGERMEKRLFTEGGKKSKLELAGTRTVSSGVVILTYLPAN